MPATPPPMTSTRLVDSKDLENSGLSRRSFSTAMRTSSAALLVLASLSLPIHDTCSRILAISNMYLLSPARSTVRRKVGSCIRGVQEATTTPSSLCSLMAATISSCPGSEQVYMVSVEKVSLASPVMTCVPARTLTVLAAAISIFPESVPPESMTGVPRFSTPNAPSPVPPT